MDFRIALDGHHAEDSALGFRGLCDTFVTALRDAGYVVTGSTYDWDSDDQAAGKPGEEVAALIDIVTEGMDIVANITEATPLEPAPTTLSGIDFASDNSAELANTLGLNASHFDGIEPSGKGGYTAKDVRRAAK